MSHDEKTILNVRRKKSSEDAAKPVHVIREGAISASVFRRQSPSGYSYLDFSLTRSWKTQTSGKTGCSTNYFAANRRELVAAIDQVTAWIQEHERADASVDALTAAG